MLMNFLQLCQRAHQESGIGGSGPTAVTGQVGRNADLVRWVLAAHEEIQGKQDNWRFDWQQGSFALTAGQAEYDPETDWGVSGGVRNFTKDGHYVYVNSQGQEMRTKLGYLPWQMARDLKTPSVSGIPTIFSLMPNGKVRFWPVPNAPTTVDSEYFLEPLTLSAPTDEPRFKAKYHMVIVWRAVMFYCEKVKDWSRFDTAESNYEDLYDKMLDTEMPEVVQGGPLA